MRSVRSKSARTWPANRVECATLLCNFAQCSYAVAGNRRIKLPTVALGTCCRLPQHSAEASWCSAAF
jgi:hypothetical protein